jgi:sec-independent protein translocase protein TatA
MGPFGPTEIILILLVALVVFGPKRLPEMGKSLGKGIREFKTSVTGEDDEQERQVARAQELPPAAPPPVPAAVAGPATVVAPPVAQHTEGGTPR